MRFLKTVKKNGAYFLLTDADGNQYRIAQYKTWRKVHIAQEPSEHYAIINNSRKSTGFMYDKLLFKGEFIIAYYSNEFEHYRYYHIYNEQGKIVYKGKVDPRLPSKGRINNKLKHCKKFSWARKYHR